MAGDLKLKILSDPKYAQTIKHLENACRFSRQHANVSEKALEVYGNHGPTISGCVRDHFPDYVKENLRGLANKVTDESALAYQAKPKGSQTTTINKIGRLIARRDGTGFYGHQPASDLEMNPIALRKSEKEFILQMKDFADYDDGSERWVCFNPPFKEGAYNRLVQREWIMHRTDGKTPEFRWNPKARQARADLVKKSLPDLHQ